jgi:hypothetical protein
MIGFGGGSNDISSDVYDVSSSLLVMLLLTYTKVIVGTDVLDCSSDLCFFRLIKGIVKLRCVHFRSFLCFPCPEKTSARGVDGLLLLFLGYQIFIDPGVFNENADLDRGVNLGGGGLGFSFFSLAWGRGDHFFCPLRVASL